MTASKQPATPHIVTFDEILKADDTQTKLIDVPEWGGQVKIQGLTKAQQLDIRKRSLVDGEVDEELSQGFLFQEGVLEPHIPLERLPELMQKQAGVIDRILTEVLRLSGMRPEQMKEAEKSFRT